MDNIQELDLEVLEGELKPFIYKWTKGENNGKVCEYESLSKDDSSGVIWLNFKDGSRINYELLDEFMMRIDSSSISNETSSNTETQETKNVRNAIHTGKKLTPQKSNPIITLLEKQKPNWVNVEMKLELNLPTKSLYNVLTSSFDEAEDEIIEFVVRDLDIEVVKESLRINIRQIYSDNGKRKIGIKASKEEQE
jgi:hypothetical protein